MKRLLLAALAVTSSMVAAPSAEPKKPNVLVILADDLGYGVLNSYGGDPARVATPNIDRLAKEGAKFTDGYVTCSVCGPSRAALMTGRYPQRFGVYANCDLQGAKAGVPADQNMLPEYFKDAGYITAMIGKWHLGDKLPGQHPLDKGFDEYFGFNSAQTDYFQSPILFDGRTTKVKGHDYLTRAFTDRAIQVIKRPDDKPFLIYLAYNAVHGPNHAPEETIKRFSHLPEKEAIQSAMTAELDLGVGRLLESLEQTGKDKNTLIFFLSDNGGLPSWWDGSNGHLRGFKRHQYDGGNKIPFLVRWLASIPAGQTCTSPVTTLDVLPTALEAAAIPAPKSGVFDGISLLPALRAGQDPPPDRCLFWAGSHFEGATKPEKGSMHDNPPPAWAVRQGDWKLIQIMQQGKAMLFNVRDDPSESKDLIATQPEIAQRMQSSFVEWFRIGGDPIAWKTEYYQQLKAIK